nr:reverse transcriptase domain-containing protein [Tanacetum cinerariifolium]
MGEAGNFQSPPPMVTPVEKRSSNKEITFPPLTTSSEAEGLLVIEVEIGGHMIHRMIVIPFQKSTGKSNLSTATLSNVSCTLTKAITRYSWQSQMKRKQLSTPAKGCIAIQKCPSASRTLAPPKRLRRYFQAHPIAVITDQPIKQIKSRPDIAGRLQKWSVMLGEHNITYRPRTSVKGHVLADFLAEISDESQPDASVVETQQEP